MALTTKLFEQLPWIGGVNTSLNEAMITHNQLVQADNLIFDTRGSRKIREGVSFNFDSNSDTTNSIIGLHDFFYTNGIIKNHRILAVTDNNALHAYEEDGGTLTLSLDSTTTAYASDVTKASFTTVNNLAIITVDGNNNLPRKWAGGTNKVFDLAGSPPDASIVAQHLGRVWMNDKDNLEGLHYSSTGNPEEWNGTGDSARLDIGIGDGDPEGITAIFPFKGQLFVAKKTKLYRVTGFTPDTFQIDKISDGIGIVSQNSLAAVDQDDVFFISQKGIHSLAATSNFGDFSSSFVSQDIQKTFNDKFDFTALGRSWGAYLSQINSIAFAVVDKSLDGTATQNNAIWLYNISLKSWYRWTGISCQSMIVVNDPLQQRFYFGSNIERLGKSFNKISNDISSAGAEVAITMTVKTGFIFPDNEPYNIKGFKRYSLIYAPTGNHSIAAEIKIDNYPVQTLTFDTVDGLAILGTSLTLGTSILGTKVVVAPFAQSVDGYGRGFQVTLTQSGTDQKVEIQGFAMEFEPASTQQEVVIP